MNSAAVALVIKQAIYPSLGSYPYSIPHPVIYSKSKYIIEES
jgi:hypothetical protein